MSIKTKIIYICTLFSLTGCFFHGEEKITVINNSGSDIFYEFNYNSDTLDYYNPFDVRNMNPQEAKYRFDEHRIVKFSQKRPRLPFESWINAVNKSKDSTLRIYFYYPDTIYHIPRETIREKKLWLKKKSYKIKDLDAIDWKVYFL
jgi:hypothetical protein